MIKFYMYRMKVERDFRPLLRGRYEFTRRLIEAAVMERPRVTLRGSQDWLIGNVEKLSSDQLVFAFGKITRSMSEKYDNDTKSFADVKIEHAPYTFVAIDLASQACAIAVKVKIAPQINVISNRLVRVLNNSKIALEANVQFVLPMIQDTANFLDIIGRAERIKKLEITFSPPNPWDVENDFHRPQEEYLKQVKGKSGKTTINGDALDKEVIKKTIRSVAATGNTALASVKMRNRKGFKTTRLAGDPVTFSLRELSGPANRAFKEEIFDHIAKYYTTIRGGRLPSRGKALTKKTD